MKNVYDKQNMTHHQSLSTSNQKDLLKSTTGFYNETGCMPSIGLHNTNDYQFIGGLREQQSKSSLVLNN